MKSRTGTFSFGLFVIVVLGAVFWLLHQQGRTNWGLVAVLVGILLTCPRKTQPVKTGVLS